MLGPDELTGMARNAGFKVVRRSGDSRGTRPTDAARRTILIAEIP
jgi:hypothetical protein